ncbi:MAG: DUF5689 domain-containing protein [Chitinophagales bacterium]
MNKIVKITFTIFFLAALSSCVRDKFDAPANGANEDPVGVAPTMSIQAFKQAYFKLGQFIQIPDSVVISGVVNADDKSGNLYKTLTIQDSTGGIQILIDQTSFFTDYPVGRRVFIKCKGLFISDYSGMVQLGAYIDNTGSYPSLGNIPSINAPNYIIKGKWGLPVIPQELSFADLNSTTFDRYQSVLVKFNDVQFVCADADQIYSDQVYKQSINRQLENCAGENMYVRSSGYANFANTHTPGGKGSITAVFSIFRKNSTTVDRQLVIRDPSDIQFTSAVRCDGTVFSGGGNTNIGDIRTKFNLVGQYDLPSGTHIHGVVVADNTCSNFGTGNLIVQDATGGITAYFGSSSIPFVVGDSVDINASCGTIKNFNGILELTNVKVTSITKLGTVTPKPLVITIGDLLLNFDQYESMLVQINNAQFSGGGGTFGGSPNLSDGTGTLKVFNYSTSCFGSSSYPTGSSLTVLGVLKQFNSTNEISQRSAADAF